MTKELGKAASKEVLDDRINGRMAADEKRIKTELIMDA